MIRKILPLMVCLCMWGTGALGVQTHGVDIQSTGPDLTITEPGRIITTVFKVTNHSGTKQDFRLQVDLPASWVRITQDTPFSLNDAESDMQLVVFMVPQNTLAGRYPITYRVQGVGSPGLSAHYATYLEVIPVTRISARILDAPPYIIAGEGYQVRFAVSNESNVPQTIRLKVESSDKFPAALDTQEVRLEPGGIAQVGVTVQTDAGLMQGEKHHLTLTAMVVGEESKQAVIESLVDIIPRVENHQERFHTLPVELTTRYLAESAGEYHGSGGQVQLTGKGTLDEYGRQRISFFIRTPDRYDGSEERRMYYGEHDDYWLSLQTNQYDFMLGDSNYALSYLTEESIYARGGSVRLNIDRLSVGGYQLKNRQFDPLAEQTALFARYAVREEVNLGVNYLQKKDPDDHSTITSVVSELKPNRQTVINLEYARGEEGQTEDTAYSVGAIGSSRALSYYLRYLHADPEYHGSYSDIDSIQATAAVPFRDYLRFTASYRHENRNLDLDPDAGTASSERFYQTGISYLIDPNKTLALDCMLRDYTDRLPQPQFDTHEITARLSWSQHLRSMTLYAAAESGRDRDRLVDSTSIVQRYKIATYIQPLPQLSCSGYLVYDSTHEETSNDDTDSNDSDSKETSLNLGLNSTLQLNLTDITFNCELKKYQDKDDADSMEYDLLLTRKLPHGQRISFQGHHVSYTGTQPDDNAAMVEYSIPLALPVSRKQSVGTVKGIIYDAEHKQGLPDVILRLDGELSVTDRKGEFRFPAVTNGEHYLDIDTSRIGLDRIPTSKSPLTVAVEGGRESKVEIGITRAAILRGRVVVSPGASRKGNGQADSRDRDVPSIQGSGDVVTGSQVTEANGLANVVVSMQNGTEILHRITDNQGRFAFEELRPGTWQLHISPEKIPPYHMMADTTKLTYTLSPGQCEDVIIQIVPIERTVRIIEEQELQLEQKPESRAPISKAVVMPNGIPGTGSSFWTSPDCVRFSRTQTDSKHLSPRQVKAFTPGIHPFSGGSQHFSGYVPYLDWVWGTLPYQPQPPQAMPWEYESLEEH